MNNNGRFNAILNSCKNPQAVYDALMALSTKPNLWRVAVEISKMSQPERVAKSMVQIMASYAGKEPPAPLQKKGAQS